MRACRVPAGLLDKSGEAEVRKKQNRPAQMFLWVPGTGQMNGRFWVGRALHGRRASGSCVAAASWSPAKGTIAGDTSQARAPHSQGRPPGFAPYKGPTVTPQLVTGVDHLSPPGL